MLPIPMKLLQAGVRDVVRISDARMSGTSFGTCVLHVSPESYVGGPLSLVENGDEIEIDVPARRITLCVDDEDLDRRRAAWKRGDPKHLRGWGRLFTEHVGQAHQGCDFDVLASRAPTAEPAIHRKV
jgi:dihydroxy-acid dehydratase